MKEIICKKLKEVNEKLDILRTVLHESYTDEGSITRDAVLSNCKTLNAQKYLLQELLKECRIVEEKQSKEAK